MELRWEQSHGSSVIGLPVWLGHSLAESVAVVHHAVDRPVWLWSVEPTGQHGTADTPEAARAAADAAWTEWCAGAGIGPAPVWRPIETAPKGEWIMLLSPNDDLVYSGIIRSDGTLCGYAGDPIDLDDDEPPWRWWMPQPAMPPSSR